MSLFPPESYGADLPPERVPVGQAACPKCEVRPIKLAGARNWLCLACYAAEYRELARQAGRSPRFGPALIAGPQCPVCGGSDVDANGRLWWCVPCQMVQRVRN
ncbi:hypothetical protein ABZ419_07440 [Streptomyces cinnamoneus]|uniref:hypothetical protein n=1 Tax=Streptomyces cinnamoneus TaxID=53446 RepID=UPI0033CEBB6B